MHRQTGNIVVGAGVKGLLICDSKGFGGVSAKNRTLIYLKCVSTGFVEVVAL